MRVLVTGGNGFLGRAVVELLAARGDRVRVFSRSAAAKTSSAPSAAMEYVSGDLADAAGVSNACAGCDAVIHTAAKAGVWGSWASYFQPNIQGTRNVLAGCRAQGIFRLVYTSTPSVVFDGQGHAGADEALPYGKNFPCHYPHTKAIAEHEVLTAHDPSALRVIALRPHLIWGQGDPHLVPRILARAHRLRIIGNGQNRVDLTHVRHAAQAHLRALDALANPAHPACGKAYFISDGAPVVLWEWINQLLRRVGRRPITKTISLKTARAAGAALEALWTIVPGLPGEPPMTRFVATELAKDHWYSIAAARRDLGYQPAPDLTREMDDLIASLSPR